jgi:hypothetical protein
MNRPQPLRPALARQRKRRSRAGRAQRRVRKGQLKRRLPHAQLRQPLPAHLTRRVRPLLLERHARRNAPVPRPRLRLRSLNSKWQQLRRVRLRRVARPEQPQAHLPGTAEEPPRNNANNTNSPRSTHSPRNQHVAGRTGRTGSIPSICSTSNTNNSNSRLRPRIHLRERGRQSGEAQRIQARLAPRGHLEQLDRRVRQGQYALLPRHTGPQNGAPAWSKKSRPGRSRFQPRSW